MTTPQELCRWLKLDAPHLNAVPADQIPMPYHHLLVHDGDMTGRLESYYEQTIHLETLRKVQADQHLYRQVLLRTADNRVVEYGVIRIALAQFGGEPLRQILGCYHPLGGILNRFQVDYHSDLAGFVRLHPDHVIAQALALEHDNRFLYGRQNRLVSGSGDTIAEVLEILPPVPHQHIGT